jgi:AcrR family transcriptional regulator
MRSDAQRNVERLKAAALEVFQERGLASALEEIARRAGVSVGTLYNRFGSREALIDAVVPDLARSKFEPVIAHARDGADAWERFARFLDGLGEMQISDPALSDAIARAYPNAPPELAEVCDDALDQGERLIEEAIAAGAMRPEFTRDDLGTWLFANAAVLRTQDAEASRRLRKYLLAGLSADPPRSRG